MFVCGLIGCSKSVRLSAINGGGRRAEKGNGKEDVGFNRDIGVSQNVLVLLNIRGICGMSVIFNNKADNMILLSTNTIQFRMIALER